MESYFGSLLTLVNDLAKYRFVSVEAVEVTHT